MTKKIVQLCKYGPTFKGGMERESSNVLDVMLTNGYKVKMIYFSSALDKASITHQGNCKQIVCLTLFTLFRQPFSIRYFLEILKIKDDEIVHLHLPNYWALLACCFLQRKTKIIVHWHSDVIERPILKFFLSPLEKYILTRAERVICTSYNYATYSSQLKFFKRKCEILPIAVDQKVSDFKKLPPNASNVKLLNIGRLVPYKNQEFLLDVIKLLPEGFSLEIIGRGHLQHYLEKKIQKMGLSKRIKILSDLSDLQLSNKYRNSDIFVLSSNTRAEAYGIVLVEALSFKLPLVTLEIEGSGVCMVNKNHFSGLQSEIGDHEGMAENILKIALVKEKYNRFSQNAFNHYCHNFSKKVYEKKLLKIYKSLK